MKKRLLVVGILLLAFALALPAYAQDFTIAMVVKGAGNPFFEACRRGGEEAAAELGFNFIFQAPATPTSEGQIELIDALIAQRLMRFWSAPMTQTHWFPYLDEQWTVELLLLPSTRE